MAKYKVGDRVRVKDYPVDVGPGWASGMNEMFGKIVTISRVTSGELYQIEDSDYAWCDEMFEGLANSTGNEVIDFLMGKLGVEVDEEFEIVGSYSQYSPHHFDENGNLIDKNDCESRDELIRLIYDEAKIRKIPKPEIKEMTVAELEEALKIPKGTLRVKGDQ